MYGYPQALLALRLAHNYDVCHLSMVRINWCLLHGKHNTLLLNNFLSLRISDVYCCIEGNRTGLFQMDFLRTQQLHVSFLTG